MTAQLDTTARLGEPDFGALAETLAGEVHLPGTPGYGELATPWNVSVVNEFAAVVAVADAADVAHVVRFAANHGLEVAVQATGHGAVVSDRPAVLVHTGRLRELAIDPTGSARVGAGIRWSDVLEAAAPHGLAGLAGSAPGVGVIGFLTGGGIGPVARTFGVSSDYVTAFDVVTGDGTMRRASVTENPALFWGLRGGKGTLGVVTAVEFDLVAVREILGGALYFDGADAPTVLHTWRHWAAGLPEEATTSVAVLRLPPMPGVPEPLAGRVTVAVRFAWVGDAEEGREALAPMAAAATPILGGVDVMPYAALGAIHADPVDPMPSREASALLHDLDEAAVDTLLRFAGPEAQCPQVIVELRRLGGAVRRARSASAFNHRDAGYSLLLIGLAVPPVVQATAAHAESTLAALTRWSTGGTLPNFSPSADPAEVARKYDAETLGRLASLAASYDPHGVIAAARPVRAAAERNIR